MKHAILWLGLVLLQWPIALALCPITANTTVVIYTGVGVPDDCQQWETKFFQWWKKAEPAVNFVYVSGPQLHSMCDLKEYTGLKIYVQPGGNAYEQQNSIKDAGKANVRKCLARQRSMHIVDCLPSSTDIVVH